MPPHTKPTRHMVSLAFRPKCQASFRPSVPHLLLPQTRRHITADEKPLPETDHKVPGPNQEQLPHVSEEAAAIGKITGQGGPEVEQGTPVEEILKRDEQGKEKAPQVLKEETRKDSPPSTRSFSTYTRRRSPELPLHAVDTSSAHEEDVAIAALSNSNDGLRNQGHIYGLPTLPLTKNMHLKHREDPLVDQVTKLIMQSGRLSRAQSTMAMILERLRTAKPPLGNPQRPLLPSSPPSNHLPLNPVLYMTLAIDSVAPLLRIRSQKGAAGGGVALQIPVPLSQRQRRRTAIMWILDAAGKKRSVGSGRAMYAHKVADEIISIVEGRSGVWEKRGSIHKLSVAARANLGVLARRRR